MPTDSLTVVFYDQLDADLVKATAGAEPAFMAEASIGPTHYTNKRRVVTQMSAMRHCRDRLTESGVDLVYKTLEEADDWNAAFCKTIKEVRPKRIVAIRPGSQDTRNTLDQICNDLGVELVVKRDSRFFTDEAFFADYAAGRKDLRLEYFYRRVRNEFHILLNKDRSPVGGAWNFDKENRGAFGKDGPGEVPEPEPQPADATTQEVITWVRERFDKNPGSLEAFTDPVDADGAEAALADFVERRLPLLPPTPTVRATTQCRLQRSRALFGRSSGGGSTLPVSTTTICRITRRRTVLGRMWPSPRRFGPAKARWRVLRMPCTICFKTHTPITFSV